MTIPENQTEFEANWNSSSTGTTSTARTKPWTARRRTRCTTRVGPPTDSRVSSHAENGHAVHPARRRRSEWTVILGTRSSSKSIASTAVVICRCSAFAAPRERYCRRALALPVCASPRRSPISGPLSSRITLPRARPSPRPRMSPAYTAEQEYTAKVAGPVHKTPNEVHYVRPAANGQPRFEPLHHGHAVHPCPAAGRSGRRSWGPAHLRNRLPRRPSSSAAAPHSPRRVSATAGEHLRYRPAHPRVDRPFPNPFLRRSRLLGHYPRRRHALSPVHSAEQEYTVKVAGPIQPV